MPPSRRRTRSVCVRLTGATAKTRLPVRPDVVCPDWTAPTSMSCALSPSGNGVTIVPSRSIRMISAFSSLSVARTTRSTSSERVPLPADVRELASETSCCCAWLRAALRVRTRLPAPTMTSTTATKPTMASIRRRRIAQPNR